MDSAVQTRAVWLHVGTESSLSFHLRAQPLLFFNIFWTFCADEHFKTWPILSPTDGSGMRITQAASANQETTNNGGGFFIACEDFRRMFENYSPPALFFVVFCFCIFKVEIRSHTLILLSKPGSVHSGSAR